MLVTSFRTGYSSPNHLVSTSVNVNLKQWLATSLILLTPVGYYFLLEEPTANCLDYNNLKN